MIHIIHDTNWLQERSRLINMLCKFNFPSPFFQYIYFRTLIMNIYCDIMLTNIDNSLDYYNSHIQKIMILQVILHIFCEMLIGGRKVLNSDKLFLFVNSRTNVQEDSSEFESLIQEMISSELFSNQ